MSEPTVEIAVWLPLRPEASWRGEGIAQTVENIISNLPSDIICNIVVSRKHAEDLAAFVENHPNVRLRAIGFGINKKIAIDARVPLRAGLFELVASKIKLARGLKLQWLCANVAYIFSIYLFSFLQRMGFYIRGASILWFPSPVIPGLGILKGRKIYSFWDPFVFEYREFSDIAPVLLKKFQGVYRDADVITTQSQANKDFLENVFQISRERIEVINNGSPSYVQFLPALEFVGRRNKPGLLAQWAPLKYFGTTREGAIDRLIKDQINKTILWRLFSKLCTDRVRVIMISTQARPYKGFGILLELLSRLVEREDFYQFQFIFTSELPAEDKKRYPRIYERVHEITRVSNKQHALLYYVSDLVLHPSYVEGGLGVYPQFEAASVGTAALINLGRHVQEQLSVAGCSASNCVDFTQIDVVVERIIALMKSEQLRRENIQDSIRLAIPWALSASKYADIFKREWNA